MIQLTRLNHTSLFLNADLIEQIQAAPDTFITLTSGKNFMVLESPEEIIVRIVNYRRRILRDSSPTELIRTRVENNNED